MPVASYFCLIALYFLLVARYILLVASEEILKDFFGVKVKKKVSLYGKKLFGGINALSETKVKQKLETNMLAQLF